MPSYAVYDGPNMASTQSHGQSQNPDGPPCWESPLLLIIVCLCEKSLKCVQRKIRFVQYNMYMCNGLPLST